MMGYTDGKLRPTPEAYAALVAPLVPGQARAGGEGQPYPFFLAHALDPQDDMDAQLGPLGQWLVEWKYDGIRAQLVKRAGQVWLWSRGEELVTEAFPELVALAHQLPDGTVIDGELMVWQDGRPGAFALLQQRLGRKRLSAALLARLPVVMMAYDLLEADGQDLRGQTQGDRRQRLQTLLATGPLSLSPAVEASDWQALAHARQAARERGVEGLMLKRLDSAYGVGRTRAQGLWWKWKTEPFTVDGVLIYAQAGHGRRASLYTDYTFAVWSRAPASAEEAQAAIEAIAQPETLPKPEAAPGAPPPLQLVAFAKAYSGLTDAEFRQVDARVRQTTLQKFGPVRSVRPSLVVELAFEGIQESRRHKSGVALRFPRMLRLRPDKPLHEANTLADLRQWMSPSAQADPQGG